MVDHVPDITSPRKLGELFRDYGLQPRRHLGQNFLIDGNIALKIVGAAEIKKGDAVLEIGPGAGALTLSMARLGARITVLEIDRGLVRLLKDLFESWAQVEILELDVLKADWGLLTESFEAGSGAVKLVSNLPYNISGPFMYNLFKAGFPFAEAVLMFQKEVAMRLVAGPGDHDYGALSVLSSYYCRGKILFEVSRNVFWPRPKVGSAVLKLQPRLRELSAGEEEMLWVIVRGLFQQRRKTILNNMSRLFNLSRARLVELLGEVPLSPAARPEELSVSQFAKLARIIYNYLGKSS